MTVNEERAQDAEQARERPESERLRILEAVGDGVAETEAMRCALYHAVAFLGGLGGMVHLRGPSSEAGLRLMVSGGLPPAYVQKWGDIPREGMAVPARAVRDGSYVWQPFTDSTRDLPGHSPAAPEPSIDSGHKPWDLPTAAGIAAAPLLGPKGPLGALSVLTATAEEPAAEERAFLGEVARWAARRLARSLAVPHGESARWWAEQQEGSGLRQALKAVRVGAWEWNIRTGELFWDEPGLTVLGIDPATYIPRIETWVAVVHPEDLPWVMDETEEAIRTRSVYSVEYRVRRPDGTSGWAQARGRVVLDAEGEPVRMVGTAWDTTEAHAARESVDHALRYMSDGFLAVDADWRITFVNAEGERMLGSSRNLIGRVLWDIAAAQVRDLETRCRQAATERTTAGFDVLSSANDRWYHLRLVPIPEGMTIYATDITEVRIRRAERRAADRKAAERASRTAQLTAALAEAVTIRDVVEAVAERVLPPFSATGLVVLANQANHRHVVGAVGRPEAFLRQFGEAALTAASPVDDVLRARAPIFISSAEEYTELYPQSADDDFRAGQAWAFLPLVVSGQATGCCVISFDRPRLITGEERTLLIALSGLIAQALERARLYDSEHNRAQELQRGLLPQQLPSLPAVTAAARYLPAEQGMDVGGDWYDLIQLSADRVALVIGDVMGHGLAEAATMGRLRTAVRTLADLELPLDEVLSHLNDLVSDLGDDFYATCLYTVYDPTTHTCACASAGHLPPLVVHPDHTVHIPAIPSNPPLGAADPPFDTVVIDLPESSLLVFYTDGLVESADRDIDRGIDHLARTLTTALRAKDDQPLDLLCDTVVSALLPTQQPSNDDAALLIARPHRLATENMASWPLPQDPVAAGQARAYIRDQLASWDLDDLAMTTELLASELISNVIRHAKGPVRLRLLRSRTLVCEVSDGSLTTPHIRRASDTDESGRGLQLVAALSQRWGTRYNGSGKSIWTEQPLPTPVPKKGL